MRLTYLALFGVAGVFARHFAAVAIVRFASGTFPLATLIINVVGSSLIGAVYVLGVERSTISPDLRFGLAVGFLGGFTTFSAYSLELAKLLEEARYGVAALYCAASSGLGVAGAALGMLVARRLGGAG